MNAGAYFGVFVRNWEAFGFANVRGLPLMPNLACDVSAATPYLHHPPALSWLFYALGGSEWAMRLPTVVASFVASVCLYRIAATRFAPGPSFVAACLLALSPGMAVTGQASYEVVVIACGLAVMADVVRPHRSRATSRAIRIGAAFLGTWCNWQFAFAGLASLALVLRARDPVRSLRPVLLPGLAALAAAVSIAAWGRWAMAAEGIVSPPAADRDVFAMVERYVLAEHAGFGWALRHTLDVVPVTWSWWLAGSFAVGFWLLLWRVPRVALALLAMGIAPFVVLLRPADYIWQTFFMPVAALSGGAVCDQLWRWRAHWRGGRMVALGGAALLVGGVALTSYRVRAEAATPFFQRFGDVLSRAAAPGWSVAHGYLFGLAYYYRSPNIELQGRFTPAELRPLAAADGEAGVGASRGWKYLWLKPRNPALMHPAMPAYLEQFPRVRVPELENCLDEVGVAKTGGIVEAWLVTLRAPGLEGVARPSPR
ncbi:MAG: glycosyltransferase family 39 protein [Planctomycetota bacterium]